jgi:hypothetical protein
MKPVVKKLGWYRNGSFCKYSRRTPADEMVCYWIVDCDASRHAVRDSIATDAQNPWIFASRKEAQIKAAVEAFMVNPQS